jgi:TonB family protein
MKTLHKHPTVSLVIGTLVVSLLIIDRLSASQDSWTKVVPEGESFSVLMPTTASESTPILQGINDHITGRLYFAGANKKRFSVLVIRKTTPQQSSLATDFQKFIELIEFSIRNVQAHSFAFEKEGSENSYQWRQYQLKIKDVVGIARLVETERVFYALVVTGADANDGDLSRFFASFAVGDRNTETNSSGVVNTPASYSQSERTVVLADNAGAELWPRRAMQISGGILNGKAISLPKPNYPLEARGISGTVEVQVLIDENGRVIFAEATDGHALLRQSSMESAKAARFSPTRLRGQPVKVSGRIVYNFVYQ